MGRAFSDRSFLKILIFSTDFGRFRGGEVNLPPPPPGIGLRTGGLKDFLAVKKEGQKLFLTRKTWGLVPFFIEKTRGPLFISPYQKGGQQLFLHVKF